MSWDTLENTGIYKQPDDINEVDESTSKTFTINFKGPYDTLESRSKSLKKGDEIETGKCANSWVLRRVAGDHGILSILCAPPENTTTVGQSTARDTFKEVWSIHSARNDVSIFGYCGDTNSTAQRAPLEAWMKEPDGEVAKGFQYYDSHEALQSLGGPTLEVAKKIAKGIDSVIRFYAVITRKRSYHQPPPDCMANLGFVDTPPTPPSGRIEDTDSQTGEVKKTRSAPGGLSSIISSYQWLKMQDDCDEDQNGDWIRMESWWGILKTTNNQSPWDTDLYGPNRWDMPYSGSGGSGS